MNYEYPSVLAARAANDTEELRRLGEKGAKARAEKGKARVTKEDGGTTGKKAGKAATPRMGVPKQLVLLNISPYPD